MATARNVKPPAPARPKTPPAPPTTTPGPSDHWILRGFDSVYRFLASVKLAVICIFTLAMVLAGATFFESTYGVTAVREYVYQHPGFAILLAFLGTNIFCAATIRYPWKRRQIGFLVTHIGLLVILAGAFVSLRFGDEGHIVALEGASSDELVRPDHSVVRVEKLDPETGKPSQAYTLPFKHGAFSWNSEDLARIARTPSYQARVWLSRTAFVLGLGIAAAYLYVWIVRRPVWLRGVWGGVGACLFLLTVASVWGLVEMTPSAPRRELLTDPHDPFTLVVKDYLASSGRQEVRVEDDPNGYPVARLSLIAKPPGQAEVVTSEWFAATADAENRAVRNLGPARIVYLEAKGEHAPYILDDFLNPPDSPETNSAARIHYTDRQGKPRVYEWVLKDDQVDKAVALPDSDFRVTYSGIRPVTLRQGHSDRVELARFEIRRGDAPPEESGALPALPALNYQLQARRLPGDYPRIGFHQPPALAARGGGMAGTFAEVEILRAEDGRIYGRAIGRSGLMGKPGPLAVGKPMPLVASKNMPMQLALRLDEARDKARLRNVFVPVQLDRSERDNAAPAIQAEMTVKGQTRSLSLIRVPNSSVVKWATVAFPSATYRVAFDYDRQDLPFSLKLNQFEPGKDPGSGSFASYRSDVLLNDPEQGIRDEEKAIWMNHPLTHRGWSLYQSSFHRADDPETGQENAVYASIFQVHYDPAWKVVYGGCALTVLGIFLQFYMRAGVFSDGGKRERERAEARVARANGVKPAPKPRRPDPAIEPDLEDL